MGEQHQGQVAVQPRPVAALVVVQAQFAFGVLVKPLHDPAHVQQTDLFLQTEFIEAPNQGLLAVAPMARQGTLPDEPTAAAQVLAAVPTR